MSDSEKTHVTRVTSVQLTRPSNPEESCVVVIYGPEIGRRITLTTAAFEVGRSPKCDLYIDQESISRHHARISHEGGAYVIRDLGSTNGTLVNDVDVREHRLVDGDQIQVGRSILKFMTGENVETHYHEEIYRLMTVDALTQIYNRRYFNEAMEREFGRSRRYARALSLLLFDIDHFKRVNDTHGHLAGDNLLRTLSTVLRPRLRQQDIFARTGGEEFAVLCPEIALEGGKITAEKLRALVQATPFHHDAQHIPCTISVGVAELTSGIENPEALYSAADAELYRAKHSGRNKVCP